MRSLTLIVILAIVLVGCRGAAGSPGQADPGTEGNGIEQHEGPYTVPSEATQRLGDAPEGRVTAPEQYTSKIYEGCRFEYWLYVPAQYREGRPTALMVFQDGAIYLDEFRTPLVFDNLIHAGSIPAVIGLFINPGTPSGTCRGEGSTRSAQYDAIDDKYTRFLLDEIVPDVVLNRYDIIDDPEGWAIAGHSSGGIAAFTVAWYRPDKFRKVMTHNGSFVNIRGGHVYPELIRTLEAKPLRVYLLSGTNDLKRSFGDWYEANNAMAAALEDRGYAYRYRSGTGSHYPPEQGVADYPDALRWLWRGYSLPR